MADNNGKKSIDERLDALTMNLELLSHQSETHDRQIGEMQVSLQKLEVYVNQVTANVEKLATLTENMAWAVSAHEARITALETRGQ